MRFRIASLALAAVFTLPAATVVPNDGIVAHEWGTFTSIADRDGYSLIWKPLVGPSGLPCFVHRLGEGNYKWAPSKVRMETPVLYFYTAAPATISVDVRFPRGLITEWYPQASGRRRSILPAGSRGIRSS